MVDYKTGIMGEHDSIEAFRALGLTVCETSDADRAIETLKRWADESYAVIFVTEELAGRMGSHLDGWRLRYLPVITIIPSARRQVGLGRQELRTAVRKATGIDMIGQHRPISEDETVASGESR